MMSSLEMSEAKVEAFMKRKNMGINAILNVVRQALSVLFPLITYPYALRVLGAEGIGKVNYSSSIVRYFSLLAMLGVTNYAIREGAKLRDNKEKLSIFITEVFSINLVTTVLSYVLLGLTILIIPNFKDYSLLMLLQSSSIILTTLGIDYVNNIYEDFFLITVRSIITHIVSLILLFLFVKTPNDYYKYAFLTVITTGIICITNLFYCRRYVNLSFKLSKNTLRHLKPMIILFANTLAIYVYVNVDTTMLGWIKGDTTVGLYTASVNVYSILKNILSAIYVVAVPRLANCMGREDKEGYKKISTEIFGYLILLLIPICVGVISLAPEIMMFMGGDEFLDSALSLRILGIALFFAIFGGFITACINITLGREKDTLIATIISALINFLFNLVAIPYLSLYGAALTTLLSEGFVLVFCFIRIPNRSEYFNQKKLKRCFLDSTIGIFSIIFVSVLFKKTISSYMGRIMVIVPASALCYFAILIILKDPYIKGLLTMLKSKFKKGDINS